MSLIPEREKVEPIVRRTPQQGSHFVGIACGELRDRGFARATRQHHAIAQSHESDHVTVAGMNAAHEPDRAAQQAAFAKLIRAIALKGDAHVQEIAIDEANGDKTQIRFSDQASVPTTLSADELERFK